MISKKNLLNAMLGLAIAMQSSSVSAAELGAFLVRLEGGYTTSSFGMQSKGDSTLNSSIKIKKLNGYNGGIGFGYVASEDIWTDITISYNNAKTKNDGKSTVITKVEDTNISSMLNGYYGFNIGNKFSPYAMIGMGASIVKSKINLPETGMVINGTVIKDNKNNPINGQLESKNTTYFAYQGGFGLAFEAMKSISFDLGYRIGNHQGGKFRVISSADSKTLISKPKSEIKHSIILGLNVAF